MSPSSLLLLLVVLVASTTLCTALDRHTHMRAHPSGILVTDASVSYSNGKYTYSEGMANNPVAWGTFEVSMNQTGWNILHITTDGVSDDAVQMYAAGYLEGALTSGSIWEFQSITVGETGQISAEVQSFLDAQVKWVRTQIAQADPMDTQWAGVGLIMQQFDGLVAGYNANPYGHPALTANDLNIFQINGDWGDIRTAVERENRPDFSKMSPQQLLDYSYDRDHCSVLIKLTGDLSEIFMAHSTWTTYVSMNRIFKHYDLQLNSAFVAAKKVSFSSYPGYLESLDDFYMMDSGLVMLETTNDVFNMSLFDLITPQSLYAWQRVRLASQNAKTGAEWYRHVSFHNSGTYNNQYAIIDLKLFKPGQPLVPNTLWVMEQIPGTVYGEDATDLLSFGYFPSYNVPFFENIYNASGYTDVVQMMDGMQGFSYQDAPRAQIFRRDQGSVVDLQSFQHIMRYNDYLNDPISKGNPKSAICARGDLQSSEKPSGCTDTKVTSASLFKQGMAYIQSGPTTNGGTLPPFSWDKYPNDVHTGEPDVYDFPFIPTQW